MTQEQKKKIESVLEEMRYKVFTKEFAPVATHEQIMGIMISQFFEWNGTSCLEVAFHALEDSNFHSEAEQIHKMLKS